MSKIITENSFENIYSASLKFLDKLSPEDTYRVIVEEAVRLVKGDYGTIALRRPTSFEKVYSSSPLGLKSKVRRKAYAYQAYISKRPIIVENSKTEEAHPELKALGIKSTIHIPLTYHNKGIGVLIVNSVKSHQFKEKELRLLQLFGSMASMAIRKTQLYDETKNALQTRDLFISMAAHEFRTPLTTINGYVQLLHAKWKSSDLPETAWIKQLYWETLRLTNLTAELLTLNRINAGKFEFDFKEIDLNEVIFRSIDNFKVIYPKNTIDFKFSSLNRPMIVGDFDKLIQVIVNLLDNAAKFSPLESTINLHLKLSGDDFSLVIEDHGPGISRKEINKIFDNFYKVDTNTKSGLGIGLYLSKYIIKQHRGSISVSSKVNLGTKVEIRLPVLSDE